MGHPLQVLLVADREDEGAPIAGVLSRAGYQPHIQRVDTEDALREQVAAGGWDVILADSAFPGLSCHAVLEILGASGLDIPLIALSDTANEETILDLLRAGARDYVAKDNLFRLPSAIQRELVEAEGRRQRKRLEAELHQAMKMEAVGRLAGGVAHDFNNLLTVITGFAQLALLDENPARAGLEQILQAAERASGLTRQLLAFSRQQALEPRILDLNQLVRETEKMLRRLIGEDVLVITRLAEEVLPVKVDPGQIEQVILNLSVNSRDAMPRGGKLILSTSRRRLEGAAARLHGLTDNDYCVFSVSDNGSGIPAAVLPHIFEPFFTTKPEGYGTGLGLSTVYGIVQQSGGAIHAYSEPGAGTTMTVFIPASAEAQAARIPPSAEAPVKGHETILIAEDDESVLDLVAESMTAHGFRVFRAENGEQALEILHARGPAGVDLLITDVVMPGMSGPLLAARATELLPRMKVLFMSGYTEDVIRHHGISRGNAAFLQKPFAPNELVRRVRRLLDAREPSSKGLSKGAGHSAATP
ncbi:MAG: response regulator [Bryobacteraceae bacterium]|jgi:signal transduction histidine kinase/ActR/RegA family two-component response regulator